MKISHLVGAVCGIILKIAVLIFVAMFVYRGAILAYDYGYRIFTEPAVSLGEGREVTVAVTKSMTPIEIGRLLEEKGLVRDARLFALQYLLSEYGDDLGEGVFTLNTAMTADEMLKIIAEQSVKEEIPETEEIEETQEQTATEETQESTQTQETEESDMSEEIIGPENAEPIR
ncbi:MAG: endolytic transglycosylase MltG [Lachnospiraceae bacterium]|jgi:UPF0755 protein|nr:endolytic transglycosylase MltG [Lachnospiraceae bacterium]